MEELGTNELVPWFEQYKLDIMKKTSIRKAAGLLPTEHFTTNASEVVNMILKSKLNYKKSDLPHLVSQIKELVHEQLEELDMLCQDVLAQHVQTTTTKAY